MISNNRETFLERKKNMNFIQSGDKSHNVLFSIFCFYKWWKTDLFLLLFYRSPFAALRKGENTVVKSMNERTNVIINNFPFALNQLTRKLLVEKEKAENILNIGLEQQLSLKKIETRSEKWKRNKSFDVKTIISMLKPKKK